MSSPNSPILGVPLSVLRNQIGQISAASQMLDQALLQRFIGNNVPTIGIDAVAAGADPTGLTDSTEVLQNILNQSGSLFLRPGIYTISSTLVANVNSPCLIYSDSQATIVQTTVGSGILNIGVAVGIVRGINFIGPAGLALYGILAAGTAAELWISQCTFKNCTTGVALNFLSQSWIAESTFTANTTDILINGGVVLLNGLTFTNPPAQLNLASGFYQSSNCYGLDDETFAWPVPRALAYQSSAQLIPTTIYTALSFNNTQFNSRNIWSSGQPTRFTAPIAGLYQAEAQIIYQSSTPTAVQILTVWVNGSSVSTNGQAFVQQPMASGIQVVAPVALQAGNFIEFMTFQNSGGSSFTTTKFTWGSLRLRETF